MKEVVSFFLSGKKYGVDISRVQGIENYVEMSAGAQGLDFLLGIVNIRDEIIPVINIKKCLVLPPAGVTEETKYLVFPTSHGTMACVVDGVSKIFKADGDDVQNFPPLMQTNLTGYADYIVRDEEGNLLVIINPENLLKEEEWNAMQEMLSKMEENND